MKSKALYKGLFIFFGAFVFSFSWFSVPPVESQSKETTKLALVRNAPTAEEGQFLVCAASCGFGAQEKKPLECLAICQRESNTSDEVIAKFVQSGFIRIGGFWEVFDHGYGFSCEKNEDVCKCSGYFDCEILVKSGCCDGPIDICETHPGGKEVCSCKKSRKCGGL